MPKLRIYQQILIGFGLIVTLPLVGVTFLINHINQQAMKKEMVRFTEHTAEALYRDFETEMSWQKHESQAMARLLTLNLNHTQDMTASAHQLLDLDSDMDAVGLYNAKGELLGSVYRNFQALSPELRLPSELELQPFEVIYLQPIDPQDSPYFLRINAPIGKNPQGVVYMLEQRHFKYLEKLLSSNNTLYGAFYIIDSEGYIIAGPPDGAELQERISPKDYHEFQHVKPGITHEFSATALGRSKKDDDSRTLEKLIVKMPEINWGIIIESPYTMKQKYIKRAGTQTLLLIMGCLVIILILLLPYILGVSRNFRQLIKGIKAMGDGNYFRRIRLLTNYFTPYEIVYLTVEFNRMARKTADAWQAIQNANQKLAQMDAFKSNLIDTVSHELRTPLTSIKGYTSRLLRYDSTLDAETRMKSLKIVKQQADRLSRLVEDLLVIPDLESAALRVYPDKVILQPVLENAVQFIQAKEHRDIQVHLTPELPEAVMADVDRLEQIVLNLLDNAVKYSLPDTPIHLDVLLSSSTHLSLTIRNIAPPLPLDNREALNSLFEKFKRLDDSLVRTTRGSGLGLFITRSLVEAMGGTITLNYNDPEFSVCFTLPVYSAMLDEDPVLET